MFPRLRQYFRNFEKQDIEILLYLILIIVLIFFLPFIWFYDYVTSYTGQWEVIILTKSLRKWVESWLDNGMGLW